MSVNCQLYIDELFQAFQVLAKQFHIIVTCTLYPQWFDGSGTSLVDGQAMVEVNHFVLRPMDHKYWRSDFWHFINATKHNVFKNNYMNLIGYRTYKNYFNFYKLFPFPLATA